VNDLLYQKYTRSRHLNFVLINFDNGEKINSIGDTVFWSLLSMLKLKRHRIPMLIGKYLSDPNNQAEFRTSNEMNKLKYTDVTYPLKYNVKDHMFNIS